MTNNSLKRYIVLWSAIGAISWFFYTLYVNHICSLFNGCQTHHYIQLMFWHHFISTWNIHRISYNDKYLSLYWVDHHYLCICCSSNMDYFQSRFVKNLRFFGRVIDKLKKVLYENETKHLLIVFFLFSFFWPQMTFYAKRH